MNAILLSAIWGVIMMFSGVFIKSKSTPKYLALAGIIIIFLANMAEMNVFSGLNLGSLTVDIDSRGMLNVTNFNLAFLGVVFLCTLFYFLLSGRDIEKVGEHVGEYFGLIFFVLCGVSIVATYNTLLLLFIGIEILSIPLYILTGADKRNLKSNEASLKYFLMGAFSTGISADGDRIPLRRQQQCLFLYYQPANG
jgi:NADH-quinone oxidoreductase subunit N